jgi:holin-like protein
MLQALTLILACQLAGELIARLAGLPVPGPVIGMLLLLAYLWVRGGVPDDLSQVTGTLLGNLSLLFVPAGGGVMVHWQRLQGEWLAIAGALLIGTPVAMGATALAMAGAQRLTARWYGRRSHG